MAPEMNQPIVARLLGSLRRRFAAEGAADCRGGRFVAVIDCIVNQNVRDRGAARFSAMNFPLLALCHETGVGVWQMPCPEIAALGFRRERPPGMTIRQALESDAARQACSELAASVAERLQQQIGEGFELLAVLGGNAASPGCAVHDAGEALAPESGIFMMALQGELRRRGIEVPFHAMRDASPELLDEDIAHFRQLLLAAKVGERVG